jgi:hypothetical protein
MFETPSAPQNTVRFRHLQVYLLYEDHTPPFGRKQKIAVEIPQRCREYRFIKNGKDTTLAGTKRIDEFSSEK